VRAEDQLDRIPSDRRAEIEDLKDNPGQAQALAVQLLRDLKGEKTN